MAGDNSLFVKLCVYAAIIISGVGTYVMYTVGWNIPESMGLTSILGKVFTIMLGLITLFLILGAFAQRAGYDQKFLDNWGDELTRGKPPI